MDISFQISKLAKKISTINETLESLYPKVSISKMRETSSPITSNLNVSSRIDSLSGIVYSISWAGHGSSKNPEGKFMLASVTDLGELTIWNTERQRPMFRANAISDDPWLLSCVFEHRECALLATGGAEGKLHLFRLGKTALHELTLSEHPLITLQAHQTYISRCEFLTTIEILTTSGDSFCKLWSLEPNQDPIRIFKGHTDDIMSLATTSTNPSIFLTGGCDSTTKLWDTRSSKANTHTYISNSGHINTIKFLNDSEHTFATGNSDGICKLYDLRSLREVGSYGNYKEVKSITDIVLSISGRLLLAADNLGKIKVWDIFDERVPVQIIDVHPEKINCMEISADGEKIASASNDSTIAFIQNYEIGDNN